MYQVIFTKVARTELIEAQDWYEREVPGLGRRSRGAVDATMERISTNPRQFPLVYRTFVEPY